MPLIHCSDQKSKTLHEFYTELIPTSQADYADVGTPMLKVLDLINSTFTETMIYGLTSHATLKLLAMDTYQSPWYVSLNGVGTEYFIHYLLPDGKQPWPYAAVTGQTRSLDDLKTYIIIAMHESQGWFNSVELERLYNSLGRK